MNSFLQVNLAVLILCSFTACEKSVPAGRIRVLNTSLDETYNVVQVSGGGSSYNLKPGDSQLMPKGTSMIYFNRRYKDYTRSYTVKCPSPTTSGISIKLLDVHLNRIAGGCKTISASKN